jgi:hypothetical protein
MWDECTFLPRQRRDSCPRQLNEAWPRQLLNRLRRSRTLAGHTAMSNSSAASFQSAKASALEVGVTVNGDSVNQLLERLTSMVQMSSGPRATSS